MARRDTPIRIPTDVPVGTDGRIRIGLQVRGRVQGVGFRPTVYRHAVACGVGGFVLNGPEGVRIEAEGERPAVEEFLRRIREEPPPAARIDSFEWRPAVPEGETEFRIRRTAAAGEVTTRIPPDLAVCSDCVRELFDPEDRRYRYPFINCTNCGPRFTIIRDLPYDRPRTSMASFPMCGRCAAEYEDPRNRRFDAQPNACPVCGPALEFVSADGSRRRDDPIRRGQDLVRQGGIVGLLGLGGFHLAADCFSEAAVQRLRERKRRPHKPFAVMFRDLETLRRYCRTDDAEIRALTGPEAPIVLLARGTEAERFALSLAPDTDEIGAFLPATPLHHLFMEPFEALVMTSGNLAEEPIVSTETDFGYLLGRVADGAIVHDRSILHRCDDSVLRVRGGTPHPILFRRSRGMVPNPVTLPFPAPPLLACGAELKSVFCLAKGTLAYPSQHIGDLEDWKTLRFFREEIESLGALLEIRPEIVVHDLHPDYLATRYALDHPAPRKIGVQHHHAHIASCMVEYGLDGEVIGVAFDGTGYGTDGTIWGGEFLVAGYRDFRRIAHLRRVPLPGGDAAIREPRRFALACLADAFGSDAPETVGFAETAFPPGEGAAVLSMIERGIRSPLTSSAGRLFDAASALLGICREATYEGQAAIRLERAAGEGPSREILPYEIDYGSEPWRVDMRPAIRRIVESGLSDPAGTASAFHAMLAAAVAEVCRAAAEETGIRRVVLSGGCWQNARFLAETVGRLEEESLRVYVPREMPPNDGGVSLGQAAIGAAVFHGG